MSDDLNKPDEIVEVRLPRSEALILRTIIKERETYNVMTNKLKSSWIWFTAGGLLTVWAFWDKIHAVLIGVK